jgi:hypothetical protein
VATVKDLEREIAELKAAMSASGIRTATASAEPGMAKDYVAYGSAEHAALLGLVEMKEGDDASLYITFTSPVTGKTYRLEDEITPFLRYPDPGQMAKLVLRQKVSSFESGEVRIPEDTPSMWSPRDEP